MSSIQGSVVGGVNSDVALVIRPSELGDVVSIYLSQAATSRAIWKIVVRCQTDQGSVVAGQVLCRAPGDRGEAPARMVATAFVPGAKGWSVTATTDNVGEQAQITLHSSQQTGGIDPGVTAVKSGTASPTGNRDFFFETDSNAPPRIAGPGSTLWSVEGILAEAGIAGADAFIQVFDEPGPLAPGDLPIWQAHVGQAAGATPDPSFWRYQPGPNGRPILFGLWVGVSSTSGFFTLSLTRNTSVTAEVSIGG
jgi:hypothetical protein